MWLVLPFLLFGCKKDEPADITYYRDALPLFVDNCVACHQDGGIGPFDLTDYPSAKAWSGEIKTAVATRYMPPWLVTDDGSCGTFRNSRALSEAEIAVIVGWVDAGTREGDPTDNLTDLPKVAKLERVDATVKTPRFTPEIEGGYLAAYDEYRCFELENPVDRRQYLTGYEVKPGNDAIIHHIIAYTLDPNRSASGGNTNRDQVDRLEAQDSREGWSCFGGSGDGLRERDWPITWAPGQGPMNFPDGTGIVLEPDDIIVAQVHYNLADSSHIGESDQTTIELQLANNVRSPGWTVAEDEFLNSLYRFPPESIPPGSESYPFSYFISAWTVASWGGVSPPVLVRGVLPHMHERGVTIRLDKVVDDTEECVMEVTDWDFEWQIAYFYEEPVRLEANDMLQVTCEWNTVGETAEVTPGWGTRNEMCLTVLFATAD